MAEAEFFGFGHSLFYAAHWSHLTAQSHLASHTPSCLNGCVYIAAEHGSNNTEVHGKVGDTQAASNIEKHILLHEFETHTLLQYSQQHV